MNYRRSSLPDMSARNGGTIGHIDRIPWLIVLFCLVMTTVPGYLVLPLAGSRFSYGALAISYVFIILLILSFALDRRRSTDPALNQGAIVIFVYLIITLFIWSVGLVRLGTPFEEAAKPTSIIYPFAAASTALYCISRIHTTRQKSVVLGFLLLGATYSAVVGLLQHVTHTNLADVSREFGFEYYNQPAMQDAELKLRLGATRSPGTFEHAIPFTVFCAAMVPTSLHFARYASNRNYRVLAVLGSALLIFAVPTGISRSGLIALAVACIVYSAALKFRHVVAGAVVAVMAAVLFTIVVPNTAQAVFQTIVNSEEDASVLIRIANYSIVADIFEARPILGNGIVGSVSTAEFGNPIDNQWLLAIVEGGILGLSALIIVTLGLVFGVVHSVKQSSCASSKSLAYAVAAIPIAMLSVSVTFDLFARVQILLIFFMAYGLLWTTENDQQNTNSLKRTQMP